jgi:hypothetical protein
MSAPDEESPERVSCGSGTKQSGEARLAEWGWVEHSVWTERMLGALRRGVKGGVWFSLIDKVWRPETLEVAWKTVRRNGGSAGSDHQSVKDFERGLGEPIGPDRSGGYTSTNLAVGRRDLWESPACGIGWSKRRCGW